MQEVERAKNRLMKISTFSFRNSDGRIVDERIPGSARLALAFLYRDRLEQVTPEQAYVRLKRYFGP